MRYILTISLVLFLPIILIAQGFISEKKFFSPSMDSMMSYMIYTPEDYEASDDNYQVVYYLHGSTIKSPQAYITYCRINQALDNLISGGKIQPTIVVFPFGYIGPYKGSYYTNSSLYGNFEDYV